MKKKLGITLIVAIIVAIGGYIVYKGIDYANGHYVGKDYYVRITDRDKVTEDKHSYLYHVKGYDENGKEKDLELVLSFFDEEEKSKITLFPNNTYLKVQYGDIEINKTIIEKADVPEKALQQILKNDSSQK